MHVIKVSDECKELEKKAKGIEKENPSEAIELYKQASQCFAGLDDPKNKNSNLEKAAKLLREIAKYEENPVTGLDYSKQSSSIYNGLGKKSEAEKVLQEAYVKFVKVAKLIAAEGRKMDDFTAAEEKFSLASEYAIQGKDEELSNKFWEESADQFYKAAKSIKDPREAFDLFKHTIINYRKGYEHEKEEGVYADAGEKFYNHASDIFKTRKALALALDNYLQASTIFREIKSEDKFQNAEKKVQEICEIIGLEKQTIIDYLHTQEINAITLLKSAYLGGLGSSSEIAKPVESDVEEFEDTTELEKLLDSDLLGKDTSEQVTHKLDVDDSKDMIVKEEIGSIPPPAVSMKSEDTDDSDIIKQVIPEPITAAEGSHDLPDHDKVETEDSLIIDEIDRMYEDPPESISAPEVVEEIIAEIDPNDTIDTIPEPPTTPEIPLALQNEMKPEAEVSSEVVDGEELNRDLPTELVEPELLDEIDKSVDPDIFKQQVAELMNSIDTAIDNSEDDKRETDQLIIDEIDRMYEDQPVSSSAPEVVNEIEERVEVDVTELDHAEPVTTPALTFDSEDEIEPDSEVSLEIDELDKLEIDQPVETSSLDEIEESKATIDTDIIVQETLETPSTHESLDSQEVIENEVNLEVADVDRSNIDHPEESSSQEETKDKANELELESIKSGIPEAVDHEEPVDDIQKKFEFDPQPSESIKDRIKSEIREGRANLPGEAIEEETKKVEIDNIFDDALEESMEEFVSDFDDAFVVEKKDGVPIISGPIIDILRDQGYIDKDLTTEEELLRVPEYQILLIIIKNHPIPLEALEEKSEISSISLVLSNLQADDLIMQTNDYQWTISQKVKDNIQEFMGQNVEQKGNEVETTKLRSQIVRNSKFEHEFISIMHKLGIVSNPDMSLADLMEIPDFAIIRTIKDKEPIDFEVMKDLLSDLPPVQVNRMLARLEADERISKNIDGLWELSDKFVLALVKNEFE